MRGSSPSQRHVDLRSIDDVQGTHKFPEPVWNIWTVCVRVFVYMCAYTYVTYATISRLRVHCFYHLKLFMSSKLRAILK